MGSPLDAESSVDAAVVEIAEQARKGNAVMYDSAFASTICLPRGVDGRLSGAAVVLTTGSKNIDDSSDDCDLPFCYEDDAEVIASGNLFATELSLLHERHATLEGG